jgi:nitrate reductase NapAB chaperone NapD
MVWGVLGVFLHQLVLRLSLLAGISAAMVLPSGLSLANPHPVGNTTGQTAELPNSKQNTRPVPPTTPTQESAVTYTQRELEQIILLFREVERQGLRPQQAQEIQSLIRELEQLRDQGQPQVVLSSSQAQQIRGLLTSLTPQEISQIQEALDLPEVQVGLFTQQEISEILLILGGIQQLRLRPQQTQEISRLIQDLEAIQAEGQPQAILSPQQTQLVLSLIESLTQQERAQIQSAVGVELAQGTRLDRATVQELISFLTIIQQLNLRPQQRQEIQSLLQELEALEAQGDLVVLLSPERAEQLQNLIGSLSEQELAQIEQNIDSQMPTPRRFTPEEVAELLVVLETAREEDLTPEQLRQVNELTEILQRRQAETDGDIILPAAEVEILLSFIDSLTSRQMRRIAVALGAPGNFPGISLNNPTGFGGGWGNLGVGVIFNNRNRFSSEDGAVSFFMGFGDPEESIALDATLSITGLSNESGQDDNLGAGSISLQASRLLPNNFSVSVGVVNLVDWVDAASDTGRSFYSSVSKVLIFDEDIEKPFSLGFVTLGIGNGVFRTEDNVDPTDEFGGTQLNVFGSFATSMGSQAHAIAEWTGQDLTMGLSVVPFRRIPLVASFGLNDLTGNAGDGVRLNLNIVYGISF